METPLIRINIEKLPVWIDQEYNNKYKNSLESLRERFVKNYSIIKLILETTIKIENLMKNFNDSSIYLNHKALLDNIIRILDMTLLEFPEFIDLEFVDLFFNSIQDRMQIFWAHFHPIAHITHINIDFMLEISQNIKIIEHAGIMLNEAIIETSNRTKLAYPLLKYIKDSKSYIKNSLKKFKIEAMLLSENKSYEQYESALEEVKNRSKGNMKITLSFIEKTILLLKESIQYSTEIDKLLEPYTEMSRIFKSKNTNLINENLPENDNAKLMKYINFLSRPDFKNKILTLDIKEFLYALKLMESQTNLMIEYNKTLLSPYEEYNPPNLLEIEIVIEKYKVVVENTTKFEEETKRNLNFMKNKETTNSIYSDIKKVADKYREYIKGIYKYQELLEYFAKIRDITAKICFQEFDLKVELICEYNLS